MKQGIRSPDRQARSELLYPLSYPGPRRDCSYCPHIIPQTAANFIFARAIGMARRRLSSPDKPTFRPPDLSPLPRHYSSMLTVTSHTDIERTVPRLQGRTAMSDKPALCCRHTGEVSCLHFTTTVVCLPKSMILKIIKTSLCAQLALRLSQSEYWVRTKQTRAGETLRGRVPKLSTNFEEVLSHAHGNS